jgi:hypothetical protein
MNPNDIATELLKIVEAAHIRNRTVGGLFNAYEKVVHYEILTALYRKGLWTANQEMPLELNKGCRCDLMIPLGDTRLFLEIKMWWFLYGRLAFKTFGKPSDLQKTWPANDWRKLKDGVSSQDHRGVLLMRSWDDKPDAVLAANSRLLELQQELETIGAPTPMVKDLAAFSYPAPWNCTVSGDAHLWLQ